MRRNRRDDEERRPRDMWGATSREKAKPTIGRSSRKLFFGPVVRECTLPDGGGLDRLSTFVRGSIPWDWSCSRRMLVRASSRPPRWIREARTRCVRSPMRATTFHLRDFIPRQIHVAKANLPILRQSSFPTYGKQGRFSWHVVLIMYLRFWAKVINC